MYGYGLTDVWTYLNNKYYGVYSPHLGNILIIESPNLMPTTGLRSRKVQISTPTLVS